MSFSANVERWALALVFAMLVLAMPSTVLAADEPPAETLFRSGRELLAEGRIDEACPQFARSIELEPTVGALVNLARCHELQGKTATAWREYREAAAMAASRGEGERAAASRDYASKLEPRLSRITVWAPAGFSLQLDGSAVASGIAHPVDPGRHRIDARSRGHAWSKVVTVDAGKHEVVTVPGRETNPPPAADPDWRKPTGIAIASLGVASLIAGTVLGIVVLVRADEAEDDPTLCPENLCTPQGEAFIDATRVQANAATVTLAVGAAAAIAGGIVFFTAPSTESAAWLTPMIVRGGGGVMFVGCL